MVIQDERNQIHDALEAPGISTSRRRSGHCQYLQDLKGYDGELMIEESDDPDRVSQVTYGGTRGLLR